MRQAATASAAAAVEDPRSDDPVTFPTSVVRSAPYDLTNRSDKKVSFEDKIPAGSVHYQSSGVLGFLRGILDFKRSFLRTTLSVPIWIKTRVSGLVGGGQEPEVEKEEQKEKEKPKKKSKSVYIEMFLPVAI